MTHVFDFSQSNGGLALDDSNWGAVGAGGGAGTTGGFLRAIEGSFYGNGYSEGVFRYPGYAADGWTGRSYLDNTGSLSIGPHNSQIFSLGSLAEHLPDIFGDGPFDLTMAYPFNAEGTGGDYIRLTGVSSIYHRGFVGASGNDYWQALTNINEHAMEVQARFIADLMATLDAPLRGAPDIEFVHWTNSDTESLRSPRIVLHISPDDSSENTLRYSDLFDYYMAPGSGHAYGMDLLPIGDIFGATDDVSMLLTAEDDFVDYFGFSARSLHIDAGSGNDQISIYIPPEYELTERIRPDLITIDGGNGNDYLLLWSRKSGALNGGAGNDVLGAGVPDELAGGTFTLRGDAGNDEISGSGNATYILSGGDGNDYLASGNRADTLDGGSGVDTMIGGAGNDTYIVDHARDYIIEAPDDGRDTVRSSVSYTLTGYIENLVLTGSGVISGVGNDLANQINGNGAANRLNGGSGNDTISGGAGNDTLDGGAGIDLMNGGSGDDIYIVNHAADRIVESAGGGTDQVSASVSFALGMEVERLVLTGSSSITGTGNAAANVMTGNGANNRLNGGAGNDTLLGDAGNDTLDGGTGADVMTGGIGNDTYIVDSAGDRINEAAGGGTDQVQASISFTLGTNVENILLIGTSAINATGNMSANTLTGNAASNRLDGGGGNDVILGGSGNDILVGGIGSDSMTGGTGSDTFLFRPSFDQDLIVDFQDNVDTIRLLDFGFTNFGQARAYAAQRGANVIFDFGDGDALTVRNTNINALADDMSFV
ncbi:calcium-binding protein [Paracoccus laeviglucosivorans]|uniref:Ca2+-binding protein, RTX toxin-related n=1 Tax=Paracoccus laeviglucosivorans TaxID=1197861 RepID=A0A521EK37_9RHOB|nr:calcium-binding protein [Paracoccus laeviglucosivorans]SMO84289.1 Ca2+-binding protein, RTX toxin-related [Paracoccus laeviglucosivorans]